MALLLSLLVLFLAPVPGAGQRAAPDQSPDTTREGSSSRSWIVLPHVFSSPETGVAGGVVGVYYPDAGGGSQQSVLLANITYTAKRQVIGEFIPELYFGEGRLWLRGELRAMEYPDVFYGIGNRARASDEEDFTTRSLDLRVSLQRRLGKALWVGGLARFRGDDLIEREEGGLLDPGGIPGSRGGRAVGAGLLATRDTRDRTLWPRQGSFIEASWTAYTSLLGSEFDYGVGILDLRHFRPVGGEGVLAVRGYLEGVEGTAPFILLPRLGGSRLLRGYREGRYRDDYLAVAQAELRLPLWWRIGATVFGGVGEVAGGLDAFPDPENWEACLGAGLRFFVNDAGGTLRLDWARARDGGGLYISVGEAF